VKSNKPERNVAGMNVLKDIRGLLSLEQERKIPAGVGPEEKPNSKDEIARYEAEIKKYKELVQEQQEELERLKEEKEKLVDNLALLRSNREEILHPANPEAGELAEEIAQLELKKSELSLALSEVMDLLQLKLKDLLKRIARIYDEAGDRNLSIEFRKGADNLENTENLAHFLQILLEE
jgi:chromosome segregation ATPase